MNFSLFFAAASISACTGGSFCDLYTPAGLSEASALELIETDRPAAQNIAANELLHANCPIKN